MGAGRGSGEREGWEIDEREGRAVRVGFPCVIQYILDSHGRTEKFRPQRSDQKMA
jgi:hypothetical protein